MGSGAASVVFLFVYTLTLRLQLLFSLFFWYSCRFSSVVLTHERTHA